MRLACGLAALFLFASAPAWSQDPALAVHLLDYIAVDYSEAVADGKVKNADEYNEMAEFAGNVSATLAKLPAAEAKPKLEAAARTLAERIGAKAAPAEVSALALQLRQAVVSTYRVAIGPRRAPDLGRGKALYAEHCASCHGAMGLGDGFAAKGMEPSPSNFHDAERQRQRSAYGLYNTITRGVEGTAMRAFGELAEADRWALAYVAANFGASDAERARGAALWKTAGRASWASQAAIAGRTPLEVKAQSGDAGVALLAYLRANPALIEQGKPSAVDFARETLAQSVELHARGDVDGATRAALTAYLEGFELAEASLAAMDADLVTRVERAMIGYRNALKSGATTSEVRALAKTTDDLLEQSSNALSASLSPAASFAASFVILLREGLEAVLVVAALLAFLRRAGQAHATRYLHAGWMAALLAGALTWYVATALITVSGAQREVTEGITGLVAAALLLYVGFWLHGKSHAKAWQAFLQRGGAQALKPGAAWGLALMAFLAVYREVFETVLFYQALWVQAAGREDMIVAGGVAAAVVLASITVAMLRYSVRLPLGLFFGCAGILLLVLAVILAGNGVAALQEAGWIPITQVSFVAVRWLGIHPNLQALGTQLVLALAVLLLWRASTRRASVT